ncbi:MAG: hypothetical protein ABMB14_35180, partial [Myxococcota bacterium]
GQVFGYHLHRAGVEIAFRVREPDRHRGPFRLYPLRGDPAPVTFDAPVVGTDAEVAAFRPDLALLTVPSDALDGPWLAPFLEAMAGIDVVALEPGPEATDVIRAAHPAVRLTTGIIAFIAYLAPLPGESRFPAPGVAYWLPPLTRCPFEGTAAPAFVEVLNRGGLPSAVREGIALTSSYGSIAMALYITALKAGGWSFRDTFGSDALAVAFRGVGQAAAVIEARHHTRRPAWLRFAGPAAIRAILRLGRRVLPLDLETYLGVHFTKVGGQTRHHLADVSAHGHALGLPVDAIDALLARTAPPSGTRQPATA